MSFLAGGESSKSCSDSTNSSIVSPFTSTHHSDSISNFDQPQPPYCSPVDINHNTAEEKTTTKTKREVYKYETDWLVSTVAWSNDETTESFELAVGSFVEDYCNQICIVNLSKDSYDEKISLTAAFDHPYPPTKISWIPKSLSGSRERLPRLLATSADYLRIWRIPPFEDFTRPQNFTNNEGTKCDSTSKKIGDEVRLECSLSPSEKANYRSPLTSFDWNEFDTRIIVTSSVDTTCAVWDVEIGSVIDQTISDKISFQLKNQILAHDHEVYDVSFSRQGSGRDIFVTAGGDGSMRLFDLRMLTTSTVLYESNNSISDSANRIGTALVRVACNKQDANYVSTFSTNSKDLIIIDVRKPGQPVCILSSHSDSLNGISWAPHSAYHLCSASDDGQALIWALANMDEPQKDPLLAYKASGKINAINWSGSHPDWIAIGFENCLELLRV